LEKHFGKHTQKFCRALASGERRRWRHKTGYKDRPRRKWQGRRQRKCRKRSHHHIVPLPFF